jgi:CubicO group peptidase (beta-lactamase class C family)
MHFGDAVPAVLVSKQFTAAAVMLLVESGHLDLREPVARWLPEGPPQWQQVTLHHLLSHTSGLPHWLEAPAWTRPSR